MSFRIALVPIIALVFANTAWAGDFTRPGWYVGVGGGVGANFFNKYIEENQPIEVVSIDPAGSFNARGGYRVWPWLAFEAMYEGAYDSQIKVLDRPFAKLSTHSFVGNLKLLLPIKRFQPYIMVGAGGQYGQFSSNLPDPFADLSRWDVTLRTAVGLDFYITEHWVLDTELAPSVRFKDYDDIPSATTDNVTLTWSVGVQYRF
jgi:opacity protein-like surface antigen